MKVILKNPLKQTTMLPTKSYLQPTPDLRICRILNGMWQVSGGHGRIVPKNALNSMFKYVDAGFTTWDLADHYGPAEDLIGEFRRQLIAQRDGFRDGEWAGPLRNDRCFPELRCGLSL